MHLAFTVIVHDPVADYTTIILVFFTTSFKIISTNKKGNVVTTFLQQFLQWKSNKYYTF